MKVLIWTTTPCTIPANLGISVHPEFTYAIVKVGDEKFLLAKDLVEFVAEEIGWESYSVESELQGSTLDRVVAKHPLYDRDSLVMLGQHVTIDAGTGCVHTAPGHGEDDFYVSKEYGIDALSPVDDKGFMNDEAPGFEGLFYDDANKAVSEELDKMGALEK